MRIGIDCRAYGQNYGYTGKCLQSFIDHIDRNDDGNKYVLFFFDRDFGEFSPTSKRIRMLKTAAKTSSMKEQLSFPFELYGAKLDLMLFPEPNIPVLYRGRSISIISDLVSYFYPEKHLKGSSMRLLRNFLLRRSIRNSTSIIVLSEVLKRDIIEIFDTPEEKIRVIPPMCLNGKKKTEDNGKQFLSQEKIHEKYILSVGELREYKNIPRLLQTYALLIKEGKMDMDLVLVGKEDPTYHEIRSNLIQLGLQGRVHIYNVLEEDKMDILYRNASLYILPSLYEGSEQSILSALDYGLPVISSLLPSITNVLRKDDAVFFRPMSLPDLKDALLKAINTPVLKHRKIDLSVYSVPTVSQCILDTIGLFGTKEKQIPLPLLEKEKK